MLTQRLRDVLAEVEQLPPEDQDAVAEAIEITLDEREWDRLLATPESERFLEAMVAQIRQEEAAGTIRDCPEDGWV